MKELISEAVREAVCLPEVRDSVVGVFEKIRASDGVERIGYVAGIITSDGPQHVEANIRRLALLTDRIRSEQSFPVFSATDVFSYTVYERIGARSLPVESWQIFWREVLSSRHVTDIFMTPRLDESLGAKDEHETARRLGIRVHYYLPDTNNKL